VSEVLDLAIELCRRASVTPADAGCQELIGSRLARAGFAVEHLPCEGVSNLWAHHGSGDPVVVLLGHTDVVPPGPLEQWSTPPFEPALRDGKLYARGAADMKGSVAAMTLAIEAFAREHPDHPGTVGLLLTSDEEGEARHGVRRVVETFQRRAQRIDHCIVGEPSSRTKTGDTVRIGRRGSLHGHLKVRGVQGHVAFPKQALNPIHAFSPALRMLTRKVWDKGDEHFPPTGFQVTNIHAGAGVLNVIPGELTVDFNFRYAPVSGAEALIQGVEAILVKNRLDYRIAWDLSGAPYFTPPGALLDAVSRAVHGVTGIIPRPDTGGGTSDGRFIAPMGAQVVELGPVNATIHKIDEHVAVADLEALERIHRHALQNLLLKAPPVAAPSRRR